MSNETMLDLDELNAYDGAHFGDAEYDENDQENIPNKYTALGKYGRANQDQMNATKIAVKEAGWMDESPNGITEIDKDPIQPDILQSSSKWKASVDQKRQEELAQRNKNIPAQKNIKSQQLDPNENDVKVVDQSYLTKDFKAKEKSAQRLIDKIVKKYSLNREQERAFRIVANHAVQPQTEKLKMYLGGMGGTGKSQVFKALIYFFQQRNESHRFIVLGPTGSSAALLNGSTYHSFLGVPISGMGIRNEATSIAQVRARLDGVDYIFLDEVSMLSCHDMYKIAAQLAKALNNFDEPYGGINMIFPGDFAQLPPVGGQSLYSHSVGTQVHSGLKPGGQEAAVGKALWHQVTTVVILRENMRQKTQTPQDASLRKALVNMRYGNCTAEDIKFLRTLQASKKPGRPKIASKEFRNVAIICGRHTQKDQINQMGCERFAKETGQKLTHFYSVDKWGKDADPANKIKWGKSKAASKSKHKSNEIDFDDQHQIWNVRHGSTEHFAGRLSLCLGMPVMIRNNDATELCITKGQEGFVVGWQAKKGPHGKRILDTLFVKLDKPSKTIEIPGLPDNVVPLVKGTKTITCTFPSDLKESIERQQVWVLPNFAMTDYAAQGKTRPYNVVHLNSCHTHMSYYTCLSRSASAAGTIILQGFEPSIVTRGCAKYLRQELREQEILDEITRLRYEGSLPSCVIGYTRNSLIRNFQNWKGTGYVPEKTDAPLRWSESDPMDILPVVTDSAWQIIKRGKDKKAEKPKEASTFVPAKGSVAVKHKLDHDNEIDIKKKSKKTLKPKSSIKLGLQWDAVNYSCAYDSLFVILYHIWNIDPLRWTTNFTEINQDYLGALAAGFNKVLQGTLTLENVRDELRHDLHNLDPTKFPMGKNGASVGQLTFEMLKYEKNNAVAEVICSDCGNAYEVDDTLGYVLHASDPIPASTSKWIGSIQKPSTEICGGCSGEMIEHVSYAEVPKIIILEYPYCNTQTSQNVKFVVNGEEVLLSLRGIIYHGDNHFTSRVFSSEGKVWFHDGITTKNKCIEDGQLDDKSNNDLRYYEDQELVLAVYSQL
jgi:hypothetical protein